MTAVNESIVRSCADLSTGDEIEAWHNGFLFHRGRVTELVPTLGLFWIKDARTGTRRLLDVDALRIVRRQAAATPSRTDPEPTAA